MLSTERLRILPLTYDQLEIYLKGDNLFESMMSLRETGRVVSPDVKKMVERNTLNLIRKSAGDDLLYITFWIVIDKALNTVVAELGFKGPPDGSGKVEIGYGTMPEYTGRGYMKEAVGAMMAWAQTHEPIRSVVAETDITNIASIRVVQNNGFIQFDRKKNMLWWKREFT